MPDPQYQLANLILKSRGVVARTVDDQPPPGETFWLNEASLEEIEENAVASRLGTTILNKQSGTAYPLGASDAVHSLSKLVGLSGSDWRYAGVDDKLYRLTGSEPGIYSLIASGLSTQPWTSAMYNPVASSFPYLFIADAKKMLKDNGYLSAPQNNGILQPQYPITAQAQEPDEIILDSFFGTDNHVTSGLGSYTGNYPLISTQLTSAVTSTGIQAVSVRTQPSPITIFQSLVIDTAGSQETVLVLAVTATGFIANFTKTHSIGAAVVMYGLSGTVAASTTATVSLAFSGTPISAWPTTLQQEDYIGFYIYVGDPNAISSITLQFNTANGAYFYRTIGQGPLQATLNPATDSSTAAADAVLSDTLGLYTEGSGGVTGLSTVGGWTPILLQLSDFSGAGGADFNDPIMNWANVTGYEVTIVTNDGIASTSFPILIEMGSLVLFGGAGPDSFAGVSYDYLFTYLNIDTLHESNPCMVMSDVNPPALTNRVLPRRQPVLLTIKNSNSDPQATYIRIYRRGGTLADNYRRIDQVPLTAMTGGTQTYTDIWSDLDIQGNDTISFTNDVPVTSTLPVPVNTTLSIAIGTSGNPVNAVQTVTPASMANISVNQQVDLGNVNSSTFEVVIVLSITGTTFTAYVQNYHAAGEPVAATAAYAQPLDIIAIAYDQAWYAGDTNNPSYLYPSAKGDAEAVSSAAYVPVSIPSDGITAVVNSRGNLFVSTLMRWWSIAPGIQVGASPTVYPTAADHGCVGKNAWCLKDGIVYYLATDGPRIFTGGASQLISEIVQFVWQGIGTTPIPIADPQYFANARVAYWNQFVFFAYTWATEPFGFPAQARLIFDTEQKRWRNDNLDVQSMFLEEDTNTLVWGDSVGLVHLDRQNVAYDEAAGVANAVVQNPIAIELQTPYSDGGHPEAQKQYQEFTLDANTNGNAVTAELLFNDGEFTETLGTVTTTQRQRVNLNLNSGAGYQGYKVSLQLTGSGIERIFLYQAKLKYLELAITRQSLDTYWCRFGDDASKVAKNVFIEYNATSELTGNIYYDGLSTPGFTFTLPQYNGVRNSIRVRLPAVKFRLARLILTAATAGDDFQVWTESRWEVKSLCIGKGYEFFPLMT